MRSYKGQKITLTANLRQRLPQDGISVGMLWILGAAFLFSTMNAGVRAMRDVFRPETLVFYRSVFQMAILLPWIMQYIKGPTPVTRRLRSHLMRGSFGMVSIFCLFLANQRLPIGLANLLITTVVFWGSLLSFLFLKERLPFRQNAFGLLAFLGVAIGTLGRGQNWEWDGVGVAAGLASGFFAGMALTVLRKIRENLGTREIVFFFGLTGTLIFTVPFIRNPQFPVTLWQAMGILWVAASGSFAQMMMTEGFKHVPTGIASMVHTQQTVFSAILGFAIFHEVPPPYFLLGALLVFLGSMGIVLSKPKRATPSL